MSQPTAQLQGEAIGVLGILVDMGVSKNNGTPKSSILIEFSIINHPFWGTPIFGNSHMLDSFFFFLSVSR